MIKEKIKYGTHPSQFGELRVPNNVENCPVIVTIHGGFWQSKYDLYENNPICKDLTSKGFATWNIEYRRVGEEGGGWPGTFNDVVAAVNHLLEIQRNYPIDLSNIIVIGHSAGGHIGLWLVSRLGLNEHDRYFTRLKISVQKVISLAGVTDLNKMWTIHNEQEIKSIVGNFIGGSPTEYPERYAVSSPMALLPKKIEQVLVHGKLDQHVPVELSRDYYEDLKEAGGNVRFIELDGIEHFKIIDPKSTAWTKVLKFIL